jgi:hypothetical protein
MGRGWRTAQKQSQDVTEQVLFAARAALQEAAGGGGVVAAGAPAPGASTATDPVALGVQLAALLGPDPMALLEAWHTAAAGSPGVPPSDSLALAERTLRRARADQG